MAFYDDEGPDLGHPDAVIRLASAVHRFRVPQIDADRKIAFTKSFKTTGSNEKTRKVLVKADDARKKLGDALRAKKVSHERVVGDARRYMPLIHQILLSCKVQPEVARLDERLLFEWTSGVEKEAKQYKSEALMYDLVMSIMCEGLGRAGSATENSISGEFAAASRDYAAAAGIFHFLANDHLPKWIAKGSNVDEDTLPIECSVGVATALNGLFMANGQQMAVATLLIKPGVPNYSLLAKLCLGIHEQLDHFITTLRKDAFDSMTRMDKEFFTLMNFQIALQKSLSLYFQSRGLWDKGDYGIAIALLSEAGAAIRPSDNPNGMPDVTKTKALSPLSKDLKALKEHMQTLLKTWELDNSKVYFESVPQIVPPESKLQEGLKMGKQEAYKLEEVEPLLLTLPDDGKNDHSTTQSDSEYARQLQEQMNRGSGANRPPPPSAPPAYNFDAPPAYENLPSSRTIQRSDSDIARELQARLNRLN